MFICIRHPKCGVLRVYVYMFICLYVYMFICIGRPKCGVFGPRCSVFGPSPRVLRGLCVSDDVFAPSVVFLAPALVFHEGKVMAAAQGVRRHTVYLY